MSETREFTRLARTPFHTTGTHAISHDWHAHPFNTTDALLLRTKSSCYHHLVISTCTSCYHHLVSFTYTSSCYEFDRDIAMLLQMRFYPPPKRRFGPNRVLTPLKSASFEIRMSSFVHPSKIFVWEGKLRHAHHALILILDRLVVISSSCHFERRRPNVHLPNEDFGRRNKR